MTYQKEVEAAFHKLSVYKGAKARASEIHGVTPNHFRNLVNDSNTPNDTLALLHQCIKQSAKEALENAIASIKSIFFIVFMRIR